MQVERICDIAAESHGSASVWPDCDPRRYLQNGNYLLWIKANRIDVHQSTAIGWIDRLEIQIGSILGRLNLGAALVPSIPITVDIDPYLSNHWPIDRSLMNKYLSSGSRRANPEVKRADSIQPYILDHKIRAVVDRT